MATYTYFISASHIGAGLRDANFNIFHTQCGVADYLVEVNGSTLISSASLATGLELILEEGITKLYLSPISQECPLGCNYEYGIILIPPAPPTATPQPTLAPTLPPTPQPTLAPTLPPTQTPEGATAEPTLEPTATPTETPLPPTATPEPTATPVCYRYLLSNNNATDKTVGFVYTDCDTGIETGMFVEPGQEEYVCTTTVPYTTSNGEWGEVLIAGLCGDPTPTPGPTDPPPTPCVKYIVDNNNTSSSATIQYTNCSGVITYTTVPPTYQGMVICAEEGQILNLYGIPNVSITDDGLCS